MNVGKGDTMDDTMALIQRQGPIIQHKGFPKTLKALQSRQGPAIVEIPRQGRLESCHRMSAATHLIYGLESI